MLLPIVDYDGEVTETNLDESQPVPQEIRITVHPRSQKSEDYVLQRMEQKVNTSRSAMAFFYLHRSLLLGDKKGHVQSLLHQLSPWLFTYGHRHGQKVKNLTGQDSSILTPEKKLVLPG